MSYLMAGTGSSAAHSAPSRSNDEAKEDGSKEALRRQHHRGSFTPSKRVVRDRDGRNHSHGPHRVSDFGENVADNRDGKVVSFPSRAPRSHVVDESSGIINRGDPSKFKEIVNDEKHSVSSKATFPEYVPSSTNRETTFRTAWEVPEKKTPHDSINESMLPNEMQLASGATKVSRPCSSKVDPLTSSYADGMPCVVPAESSSFLTRKADNPENFAAGSPGFTVGTEATEQQLYGSRLFPEDEAAKEGSPYYFQRQPVNSIEPGAVAMSMSGPHVLRPGLLTLPEDDEMPEPQDGDGNNNQEIMEASVHLVLNDDEEKWWRGKRFRIGIFFVISLLVVAFVVAFPKVMLGQDDSAPTPPRQTTRPTVGPTRMPTFAPTATPAPSFESTLISLRQIHSIAANH